MLPTEPSSSGPMTTFWPQRGQKCAFGDKVAPQKVQSIKLTPVSLAYSISLQLSHHRWRQSPALSRIQLPILTFLPAIIACASPPKRRFPPSL